MPEDYHITVTCGQGTQTIPIECERKKRKQLVLRVYPKTGRVLFSLPLKTPEEYARRFLAAHMDWLRKQLEKVLSAPPRQHSYQTGDVFYYLGQPLALAASPGRANRAEIVGGQICLSYREPFAPENCRAILAKYFKNLLPPLLAEALGRIWPLYAPLLGKSQPPELKIRKMTSRWGVCRPLRDQIVLSARLVHMPVGLLDYVLAHELCHFGVFDHSPRFWQLLEKGMPDCRKRRRELASWEVFADI